MKNKNQRGLALTVVGLAMRVHAETITGNGNVTNRIELAAGEVAFIQTAVVTPWATLDHFAMWEGVNLGYNWPDYSPSVASPLVFAGPGSLSMNHMHMLTFQRVKMTNATTVVVHDTPVRIPIGRTQRLTLIGCTQFGGITPVSSSLIPSGVEFTSDMKDTNRIILTVGSTPVVVDGPWDLMLWTHNAPVVVTSILQEQMVTAPVPLLNGHRERAIEVQSSEDGKEWDVDSLILPGENDRKFFRLK